ncbi:hypothetical protein EV361DRAFT_953040 [Lentinula raphanica]|nr:hypothetical protein EV361DRAFT_953040 [Lentinula raphanica]
MKRNSILLDNVLDLETPFYLDDIPLPDHPLTDLEAQQFAENLDNREALAQLDALLKTLPGATASQGSANPVPVPNTFLSLMESITSTNDVEDHGDTVEEAPLPPPANAPPPPPANAPQSSPNRALHPLPTLSPTVNTLPPSTFEWTPGAPSQYYVNGQVRDSCSGKGCVGKESRINKSCTYKFCSNCCRDYCAEKKVTCRYPNHRVTSKTSKPPPSSTVGTPMYTPNRPLTALHYNHQKKAQDDFYRNAQCMEQQRTEGITASDTLEVECKTYPYFTLLDCSEPVLTAIGATGNALIQTFNPSISTWVLQEKTAKRLVVEGEILLFRPRGLLDGEGMREAEEAEVVRRNPSKRRTFNPLGSSPSKRKIELTYDDDEHQRSVRPRLDTVAASPARFRSPFPTPPSPTLAPLSRASSPELPDPSMLLKTENPLRSSTVQHNNITDGGALTKSERILPNSNKAPWPYRYFAAMKEGFEDLDSSRGLSPSDVFPRVSTKTFYGVKRYWVAAQNSREGKALVERFANDPRSIWKDFEKVIGEIYGGDVPALKGRRKKEATVKVKAEPVEPEIIELSE